MLLKYINTIHLSSLMSYYVFHIKDQTHALVMWQAAQLRTQPKNSGYNYWVEIPGGNKLALSRYGLGQGSNAQTAAQYSSAGPHQNQRHSCL